MYLRDYLLYFYDQVMQKKGNIIFYLIITLITDYICYNSAEKQIIKMLFY